MTKKRRNLRILASIIAAGCVWATGMGNAWANADYYVPATAENYIAINDKNIAETDLGTEKTIGNYQYVATKVTGENNSVSYYWVRKGYGVENVEGKYHITASNDRRLDVYQKVGEYPDRSKDIVFVSKHIVGVTDTNTAINKDALNNMKVEQFTAVTNSGSTGVGGTACFYILRDGAYVNVGGYDSSEGVGVGTVSDNDATDIANNFYAFTEADFDPLKGKYMFKGEEVEYEDVYLYTETVDENTKVNRLGVFLTKNVADAMHIGNSNLLGDAEVYKGPVYGLNNEILVSAYNENTGKWSTVWGAAITDPNATVASMKISQLNDILAHMHEEDVKLALADIENTKVQANSDGFGGGINLYNKENRPVPGLTMNSVDGTDGNGDDTYVTVSDAGGWRYDATKKEWVQDSSVQANSFRLKTGSIVSAVDPKPINNDRYFNTLKINGVDYKIESVSDIDLTQENGNLVVKLITNAGDVIASDEIKIGDFIIDYGNGIPGEQGPSGQTGEQGQPGQSGTGNQTSIEEAINYNYTNITNNTTEINKIKNDYVTNIRKDVDNEDIWYVTQNVDGDSETLEFKDKHITGHTMTLEGDSIKSTITNNFDNGYINTVRVGDATIRYDGDNNQAGDTQVTNSTIEQAINNNYSKIVNIENNNVTNISERQTEQVTDNYGKTYNVNYYNVTQTENGEDASTTIKDTTLVQKNLFGEGVRAIDVIVPRVMTPDADGNYDAGQVAAYQDMVNNNALIGYIDQTTGVPEIVLEFQDTSGNVVQGAVDFATLFAESLSTEAGANIEVTQKARGLGNYTISLASNLQNMDGVQITDGLVIDNNGIKMNGDKITELADGEVSETSQDAINGSQLWKEQQDRIAGDNMLGNRIDKLGTRLDKVGAGAAALAALHPMDFDPDDKLQFSAGVGNYKGETAAAIGAFYRPTEKVMFSVAGTMGNGENMVNAGVTFALDRKNNVSNSRVAMAHEIKDLRDQVAALTALVSQIAGKANPLLDTVMFPDVPENHWAYDYVENLQKRGIIEGYPDGNFAGDRSMTRYEYAAMLYRALEKGFPVDGRLLKEFEAELGRIRIDRIKGADDDANKVERVRVNDYEDRDDYGSKLAQVVADAAPVVEEEPAA